MRPFETMPEDARIFYTAVFAEVMLNISAVRHGLFDTYLCETADPAVRRRFRQQLPYIVRELLTSRLDGEDDGRG